MITKIAFWTLTAIMLSISLYYFIKQRLRIIDVISAFTLWGGSIVIDKVLSTYFKLYYYVDPNHTPIYALFYDVIVYPAFAILYSRWFPVKRKLINLALYNLAWAIFMTALELAYIFPTRVIVYLDWHIVPDSILFYVIGFPFYCCYYLLMEKWLKNVSHE